MDIVARSGVVMRCDLYYAGTVPYEWFPAALAVVAGRGIEPYEVMQVLNTPGWLPVPARSPDGLSVLTIWGRTTAGRPLIVAVRLLGGRSAMILGARDMDPGERERLETWEKSK